MVVRSALWKLGGRYRVNDRSLPGSPDISNKGKQKAIFVHGCFWHAHANCPFSTLPKRNAEFWRAKFDENRDRDRRNERRLREMGFDVLLVWGCELAAEQLQKRLSDFWFGGGFVTRPLAMQPAQSFAFDRSRGRVIRRTTLRSGKRVASSVVVGDTRLLNGDLRASFDRYWLDLKAPPRFAAAGDEVNILDLFSGCGAMTLGALEAARALGMRPGRLIGCDSDPTAVKAYRANFRDARTVTVPLNEVFGEPGSRTSISEMAMRRELASCDLLLGGPPCQGHSDLNNHTRRSDPRNRLILPYSPRHS
ncbi:MAG: DNA mismatch endonuclease Vsr [Gemmatimonadetes bacterium]|nr:DNA mismatch endonuclease Vsr [Gemmatimonadota bacterium]